MVEGMKFRVWWMPQVPMVAFYVDVDSVEQGRKICDVLANYDAFQFENDVKPDYCNACGVSFNYPPMTEEEWWDVPDDEDEWDCLLKEAAYAS